MSTKKRLRPVERRGRFFVYTKEARGGRWGVCDYRLFCGRRFFAVAVGFYGRRCFCGCVCFYEHGHFEDIAAIAVADILRSPLFLGLWAFCGCRCFAFAAALAAIGAFCVYNNKETRGKTRVRAAGLRSGEPLFF